MQPTFDNDTDNNGDYSRFLVKIYHCWIGVQLNKGVALGYFVRIEKRLTRVIANVKKTVDKPLVM